MPENNLGSRTNNPLAVFAPNPVGVYFENQEKGEVVILLLRQHLVSQIASLIEIIVLILVPFIAGPVVAFLKTNTLSFLEARQVFWILVFWYLFAFGFAFYKFIHWYFNVYLLTNERIVDFDFRGILHMETAYANLNQIQDVTPKIIGFFGTFFHFGNVFIQTAAEKPEFEFLKVEKPDAVAQKILEQVRLEEGEAPGEIA
ncbi:MAG: hypothetical protein AAB512_05255 [Patescibacteria group bacterium]